MRPTLDEYFLRMAGLVATRSTCLRRSVGCVLVDARGHVLSTGYNGVAAGTQHCNQPSSDAAVCGDPRNAYPHACAGAFAESGFDHDRCQAVHAEQNALLQCRDVWSIETCYATTSPCATCAKLLRATSCLRIVCAERYAPHWDAVAAAWSSAGRTIEVMPKELIRPDVAIGKK